MTDDNVPKTGVVKFFSLNLDFGQSYSHEPLILFKKKILFSKLNYLILGRI